MADTKEVHGRLSNRLEDICGHAQKLLDATEGKVDEKSQKIRERLQKSLDTMKEEYHVLEDKVSDKLQTADRMVKEKPYQALGVSLGVGIILGWLLHRK